MNIINFGNKLINNVNSYLIVKNNKCILIDTGDDAIAINKYINDNNLVLTDILITHGHFDHIKGLELLINDKVNVWIGKKDVKCLFSPKYNFSFRRESWFLDKEVNILPIEKNYTCEINDILIEMILIKGHTPGSVIFKIDNNIFVGDTIFKNKIGFHSIPRCSNKKFIKSLKLISNMVEKGNLSVYPGHHEVPFNKEEINKNQELIEIIK